jgi:hypothetical protein
MDLELFPSGGSFPFTEFVNREQKDRLIVSEPGLAEEKAHIENDPIED